MNKRFPTSGAISCPARPTRPARSGLARRGKQRHGLTRRRAGRERRGRLSVSRPPLSASCPVRGPTILQGDANGRKPATPTRLSREIR